MCDNTKVFYASQLERLRLNYASEQFLVRNPPIQTCLGWKSRRHMIELVVCSGPTLSSCSFGNHPFLADGCEMKNTHNCQTQWKTYFPTLIVTRWPLTNLRGASPLLSRCLSSPIVRALSLLFRQPFLPMWHYWINIDMSLSTKG